MMRRNLLRVAITCGVGGLLFSMSTAEGAVFALRAMTIKRSTCVGGPTPGATCATSSNCGGGTCTLLPLIQVAPAGGSGAGQELDPNPQQITAMPFDEITAEIRIFNFPEMNATLGADIYQAVLANRTGATSGGNPAGLILPRGWDAPVTDSTIVCLADVDCAFRPGLHCEGENPPNPGVCQGANHNPLGNNFFIDIARPDFLHAGRATEQQFVAAPSLDQYIVVSLLDADDPTPGPFNNPTNDFYGGTIIYTVGQFACGQFTFGFNAGSDRQVLLDLDGFPKDQQITTVPLIINMTACPPLIDEEAPDNCSIDARRPWTETEPVTTPIPASAQQGLKTPVLEYNVEPTGKVAGSYTMRRSPLSAAPAPAISSVTHLDGPSVQLNFNTAIPIRAYTCVKQNNSGIERCWGFLPGDVSENGVTNALDIEDGTPLGAVADDLIEWLREFETAEDLLRCDMDRSGSCNSLDILTAVNMLNGSGSIGPGGTPNGTATVYNGTGVWLDQTFINNVACPSPD